MNFSMDTKKSAFWLKNLTRSYNFVLGLIGLIMDKLLLEKISDALSKEQKANWVRNLLQEMRREGLIDRVGAEAGLGAKWILSKPLREA
jgi:peptidoglycan biosynthesis protein MviN/MurJ (putative lipid II flippase)